MLLLLMLIVAASTCSGVDLGVLDGNKLLVVGMIAVVGGTLELLVLDFVVEVAGAHVTVATLAWMA